MDSKTRKSAIPILKPANKPNLRQSRSMDSSNCGSNITNRSSSRKINDTFECNTKCSHLTLNENESFEQLQHYLIGKFVNCFTFGN